MIEIATRVSNDEKRMTKKKLHYPQDGVIKLTRDDPTLQKIVAEAHMEFADEPDDTRVIINMSW